VGPLLPAASGHRFLFTMIDRSTRWFEAIPLETVTATLLLDSFVHTWVARFGMPAYVTTDRGAQFTSGTWSTWCSQQGVTHIKTTAFHPQSNGMVERLHRQIKEALRARGAAEKWYDHLPWVLLALRTTPKDESNISAAEATLGQQLVLPGQMQSPEELRLPDLRASPAVIPPTRRTYAEVLVGDSPLERATYVYVRKGGVEKTLDNSYDGPFYVLERGHKTFKLQMGEKTDVVSRDRLKPHLGDVDPPPAVLRTRGRPPRVVSDTSDVPS